MRSEAQKNLAYSLAHLGSLLLQLQFRPFQSAFFNSAEAVFHVLLIVLSMTLSVFLSPRSEGTQIVLFLLVVPPVAKYAIVAAVSQLRSSHLARAQTVGAQQFSNKKELHASESSTDDVAVQLSDRQSGATSSPQSPSATIHVPAHLGPTSAHQQHREQVELPADSAPSLTAMEMTQVPVHAQTD